MTFVDIVCLLPVTEGCEVAVEAGSVAFGKSDISEQHAPVHLRPTRQEKPLGRNNCRLKESLDHRR